jgi:hypothetical protein
MLISLFLIFLLTIGGLGLTYLFAEDESLLWRLCAGSVVGSIVFGLVCFLAACLFGFSVPTVLISIAASLAPLIIFARPRNRANLLATWQKAKTNLEGANLEKILSVAYYVAILSVLWWFFDRAIFVTKEGIFTGGSHNLGDLPFHLGAIFSFTEGQNFPPENPSYAFAKFSYPFITDLIAAGFIRLGASVRGAIYMQDVCLGFSLFVLLEKFTFKFTASRLAGKIAPLLLMFSGGLGFMIFFNNYGEQGKGFFDFIFNLPADYTIHDKGIRWGNALTTLFLTQRSILLGMPLTLIVLQKLWEVFASENTEQIYGDERDLPSRNKFYVFGFPVSIFIVGLLAGTLPLIHAHSLAALFVIAAFLFFFRLDKWREWIVFGLGVSFIAVPELLWIVTGSATRLTEFVDWNFGWDKRDEDFFVFWAKNLGFFTPLLLIGLYPIFAQRRKEIERRASAKENGFNESGRQSKIVAREDDKTQPIGLGTRHLLFYLPFIFLFVVTNIVKLAPWEWDNIKVLIYWFIGSIPFVALVLAKLWEKNLVLKTVAAACLILLTASGVIDVWRVMSKQINYNVFSKNSVAIAEEIKQKTQPNALFLNAPTYNSAVVLSGRRSLMRYNGHLSSYGIDYGPREDEVKQIYEGSPLADNLLQKNNIEYVIVSPEERGNLTVNEDFFKKFPVVAEIGQHKIYQVKK